MVGFQVADVTGERGERHLVGVDQQYIQQVRLHIGLQRFFGAGFHFHAIVFQQAAAYVFQLPTAVCLNHGGIGMPLSGEPEIVVVLENGDAVQRAVGQHFFNIDDVALLFHPQTAVAGTDFAFDGAGFHIGGITAGGGRSPFAGEHCERGENQAEAQQDADDFAGAHAAGFDHG